MQKNHVDKKQLLKCPISVGDILVSYPLECPLLFPHSLESAIFHTRGVQCLFLGKESSRNYKIYTQIKAIKTSGFVT